MNYYLKILGSLLIVFSSTITGFYFADKLNKRRNILTEFLDFFCNLETNIRFSSEDIFTSINKSLSKNLRGLFIKEDFNSIEEYWNKSIENIPKFYGLKKEDYRLLKDFAVNLGTTDVLGQENHIELYKTLLKSQIEKAENEYKKKSKTYKVLGFFAGFSCVLVII